MGLKSEFNKFISLGVYKVTFSYRGAFINSLTYYCCLLKIVVSIKLTKKKILRLARKHTSTYF